MRRTIQRLEKELVITLPERFVKQNGLHDGSQVKVVCSRRILAVEVARRRYKLADLMAEMPEGLPRVEGYDDMPEVGLERQ